MKNFLLLTGLLCTVLVTTSAATDNIVTIENGGMFPTHFTQNAGQAGDGIKFACRSGGARQYITDNGLICVLTQSSPTREYQTVSFEYIDAAIDAEVRGEGRLPWVNNYLRGNDPTAWVTKVPNYEQVRVENLYEGVDVLYYSRDGQLEYDLVVAPGTDPSVIRFACNGAVAVTVGDDGQLALQTSLGSLTLSKPVAYQDINGERVPVDVVYQLADKTGSSVIEFSVGHHDVSRKLVIDPFFRVKHVIGTDDTMLNGVDMDSAGYTYVTGSTESDSIPGSCCAHYGEMDAIVMKLDTLGRPMWITYIGGSAVDKGRDVAAGPGGRVYVAGGTYSSNFPIEGPYVDDEYDGSGMNAFVLYLNPDGDAILYSTYMGGLVAHADHLGVEDDYGTSAYAITVDDSGYFYVAGATAASSLPATTGAWDETYYGLTNNPAGGVWYLADVFVTKFSPTGSLTGGFSTYIGNHGIDVATGIAVDDSGHVYVTGWTSGPESSPGASDGYPLGVGSYYHFTGLSRSAFVTKLSPEGATLDYSVIYGGCNWENRATAIALDDLGAAYVTGYTANRPTVCSASPFPTTAGAYDTTFNLSEANDGFVFKVNPTGTAIEWSTLFGGEGEDTPHGIAVDEMGAPYVTGVTDSPDFPEVDPGGASVPFGQPPSNLFLMKFDNLGSILEFSGWFGEPFEDHQFGPALAYSNQRIAFTGWSVLPGMPDLVYGQIYRGTVADLYQPMVLGNINLAQGTLQPMLLDSMNQKSLTIDINTTGVLSPLTVTEFQLSTNGSTTPANMSAAKLFYAGSSGVIDTTKQFAPPVPNPAGTFTIPGSQRLSSGSNQFVLTYDIPASATIGDIVDAECLSITIDGGAVVPSVTAPSGGKTVASSHPGFTGIGLVGTGGDFSNLNEAMEAIAQHGQVGDLALNLAPGRHYGQLSVVRALNRTRPDQAPSISGNLIIQSIGPPDSTILEFFATDSAANFIIQAAGWDPTSSVTIENLTLNPLGNDFATAVELTEGVCNLIIRNCIFNGVTQTFGSPEQALIKTWVYGGFNRDIRIEHNTFNNGSHSVYMEYGWDLVIDSNTFNSPVVAGINLHEQFNPHIGGNIFNTHPPDYTAAAILLRSCFEMTVVEKNRISTGHTNGIMTNYLSGGTDSLRALIANNFVSLTGPNANIGISCMSSDYFDIFHNNINLNSPMGACISTLYCSEFSLANNVLVNSGGGLTIYDMPAPPTPAKQVLSPEWSDHNAHYTTGDYLANLNGVDLADLAELQAATGMESHSLSVDPQFVSETDLHTTSPRLVGAGIYLDRVPDDIDGNPRDPANPSIGGGVHDPTDVGDDSEQLLPKEFSLEANYPNPFNPVTEIAYNLPVSSEVSLRVYNVLGQVVIRLVDETKSAGRHTVSWNGTSADGEQVATGVYFYRIEAGDFSASRKMLLLK